MDVREYFAVFYLLYPSQLNHWNFSTPICMDTFIKPQIYLNEKDYSLQRKPQHESRKPTYKHTYTRTRMSCTHTDTHVHTYTCSFCNQVILVEIIRQFPSHSVRWILGSLPHMDQDTARSRFVNTWFLCYHTFLPYHQPMHDILVSYFTVQCRWIDCGFHRRNIKLVWKFMINLWLFFVKPFALYSTFVIVSQTEIYCTVYIILKL